MLVKFHINRLETILKQKFPEINVEIYYSKRKKMIHLALEKSLDQYRKCFDFLDELESFHARYLKNEFDFSRPIKLVNTIKWKFDYIIFRKRRC